MTLTATVPPSPTSADPTLGSVTPAIPTGQSFSRAQELLQQKKARLAELMQKKLEWQKKHRIYYYSPYSVQQGQFHSAVVKVRLVIGTNRSGKTTCGAVEDISYWLGFRPWLLPEELKTLPIEELLKNPRMIPDSCRTPIKPPCKILIVVADWDVADDIWTLGTDDSAGKLKYYLPEGALEGKPERNNMGNICQYWCKNGSLLRIDTQKSFVNDPQSFEGQRLDLAHYDEPPPRALRVAVARGLVDRNGDEIFTMTPLVEPWVKNEIADRQASDPSIQCFFLHAKQNPYISQAGWDKFVSTLNEDEKAARAEGEWIFLRGLVYKEFQPKLYTPDNKGGNLCPDLEPEWVAKHGTVYLAIDPHPRQPHAAMLLVATRKGQWIVWREVFKQCLIEELVDLIKAQLVYQHLDKGAQVTSTLELMRQICDPLAFEEDPIDGKTWADEFGAHGLVLEKAPKRKAEGILKVKEALKSQQLLVCAGCTRTIWEFQNYMWGEYKDTDRNAKEKPKDANDHMMENLYRLLLLEPPFVDAEEKSRPIQEYQYV